MHFYTHNVLSTYTKAKFRKGPLTTVPTCFEFPVNWSTVVFIFTLDESSDSIARLRYASSLAMDKQSRLRPAQLLSLFPTLHNGDVDAGFHHISFECKRASQKSTKLFLYSWHEHSVDSTASQTIRTDWAAFRMLHENYFVKKHDTFN
jgi:hypothetical protein